jgi:hypothetical protein
MRKYVHNEALFIFAVLLVLFLTSCKYRRNIFEVKDFEPLTNWNYKEQGIKTLYLDYTGAIQNGFIIPTANQVKEGEFIFRFSVKNRGGKAQKLYYKIYYQDESYKFPEYRKDSNKANSLAAENFYGSWENLSKTFAETEIIPADGQFHAVVDSFCIVGNPRDEKRYYGPAQPLKITKEGIELAIKKIKFNPTWYKAVVEKANKEKHTIDEQLKLDAIYVINEEYKNEENTLNNRWKRNPRVGKYSFMLVVTSAENIEGKKIPEYVMDIGKMQGKSFVNPYYYFLYKKDSVLKNMQALVASDSLKVIAKPDLGKGIYISPYRMRKDTFDTHSFTSNCGNSARLFEQAPFEQYVSAIAPIPLNNIPVTSDVEGNEYTMADYKKASFTNEQLVDATVKNTECPCATVKSDSQEHKLELANPASPPGKWIKEDVGLISRHGLTYGKYFVKIKLPKLLNKTDVWDGLTNSIWLIFQEGEWNYRRPEPTGYLPSITGATNASTPKTNTTSYSEIDFEILKASHYWPESSYRQGTKHIPHETPTDSNKIMVTCTNWDMGCRDVPRYTVGVDSIPYKGSYYGLHRWDHYYRALTGKDAESDDELFGGSYYYFEIEWNPGEIIWRIGPEKDKMKVVGYMNDSVTSIPNNQMVLVITKEFHYSVWWPNLPMPQEKIPFPAKDIVAYLYDFTVE